jgi:hypothetical protein
MKTYLLQLAAGSLAGLVLTGIVLGLFHLRTKDEYVIRATYDHTLVEWAPNNFGPNIESVRSINAPDGTPLEEHQWEWVLQQKNYDVLWVSTP